MKNRATAERAAPRLGVIASVLLHLGLVAALLVSFTTKKLDIADQSTPIVPVDLVTVADRTNITPMAAPEPPPEPQMVAPAQQPDITPPKVEIAADAKTPPKKAEPKFNIGEIYDNLKKQPPKNAKPGPRTVQGVGDETALAADLNSFLASQIYRCWSPPVGAVNAGQLIVVYEVFMNKDGTVSERPKLLSQEGALNTPRDAANQAAMRAIYQCQPYKLPANRYNEWRHFSFSFNPQILAGQ